MLIFVRSIAACMLAGSIVGCSPSPSPPPTADIPRGERSEVEGVATDAFRVVEDVEIIIRRGESGYAITVPKVLEVDGAADLISAVDRSVADHFSMSAFPSQLLGISNELAVGDQRIAFVELSHGSGIVAKHLMIYVFKPSESRWHLWNFYPNRTTGPETLYSAFRVSPASEEEFKIEGAGLGLPPPPVRWELLELVNVEDLRRGSRIRAID